MNESILLVEDEQALRTTLSDRLRGEGYIVDTAVDGQEGFDKASNLPYDLIILDIMLPRRNGLDVCRDIRQAGMATPILILTVRNETVDKVVGLCDETVRSRRAYGSYRGFVATGAYSRGARFLQLWFDPYRRPASPSYSRWKARVSYGARI
jgi:CheY-like chemotaxis protein